MSKGDLTFPLLGPFGLREYHGNLKSHIHLQLLFDEKQILPEVTHNECGPS